MDIIISKVKALPTNYVIADIGCGDAKLSASVPNKVHSFDLVALNERVTEANMKRVWLAVL